MSFESVYAGTKLLLLLLFLLKAQRIGKGKTKVDMSLCLIDFVQTRQCLVVGSRDKSLI